MPAEAEGVLVLEADVVTAMGPLVSLLVEQSGMPGKPVGLVEVGRFTVPALVMGFEPDGSFAGVLAGQQPGQPGGPDVGVFAALGQGLFTGSGLVSVVFDPVYFGVRRAHKGRLSSNREPEYDGGGLPSRGAANGA